MRQRRDGLGFPFEPMTGFRVRGDEGGQNLDGDRAVEPDVTGAIHFAHPAGAEHALQAVRAEPRAGFQGHRGVDCSRGVRAEKEE